MPGSLWWTLHFSSMSVRVLSHFLHQKGIKIHRQISLFFLNRAIDAAFFFYISAACPKQSAYKEHWKQPNRRSISFFSTPMQPNWGFNSNHKKRQQRQRRKTTEPIKYALNTNVLFALANMLIAQSANERMPFDSFVVVTSNLFFIQFLFLIRTFVYLCVCIRVRVCADLLVVIWANASAFLFRSSNFLRIFTFRCIFIMLAVFNAAATAAASAVVVAVGVSCYIFYLYSIW